MHSATFTNAGHGSLAVAHDPAQLAAHRRALFAEPWTWLRQVHGADVVTATRPGEHAGTQADAAVTTVPGVVIAVQTADCAPVLLSGPKGIAVVHAGWRGLVAGVIEAAASTLSELGAPPEDARLGPCIRPRCYEFGAEELQVVEDCYGPSVRSMTATGAPALDLGAGVAEACRRLGLRFDDDGTCTACSPRHFSHRARGDRGRQGLVARFDG